MRVRFLSPGVTERLYDVLFDEEQDARACADIPEEACRYVPGAFLRQLAARSATRLGDALSSPRLVLTWLLAGMGASGSIIALLVPIREAGALLPQVIVGGVVRRFPIRKWFWVVGAALQGLAVLGIAACSLTLSGPLAWWTIIGLVVTFSLARGITSVTSKDLVGKTIPKTRRGRLSGIAASIAGVVTLAVGVGFGLRGAASMSRADFAGLLLGAGALWLIAAATIAGLREIPGATAGGVSAWRLAGESFALLGRDRDFRRFVVARGLLASTVLATPFYVLLAREASDTGPRTLGVFLVAGSLAATLSGTAWGHLADRSSRWTLILAGATAGLVGFVTFGYAGLGEGTPKAAGIVYPTLFFVLSVAHTGIRVGRKTYLVDMAPADERASYVAVSNTVIGVVLLASGSFGVMNLVLSARGVVLVYALLGVAGAAIGATLREVES